MLFLKKVYIHYLLKAGCTDYAGQFLQTNLEFYVYTVIEITKPFEVLKKKHQKHSLKLFKTAITLNFVRANLHKCFESKCVCRQQIDKEQLELLCYDCF